MRYYDKLGAQKMIKRAYRVDEVENARWPTPPPGDLGDLIGGPTQRTFLPVGRFLAWAHFRNMISGSTTPPVPISDLRRDPRKQKTPVSLAHCLYCRSLTKILHARRINKIVSRLPTFRMKPWVILGEKGLPPLSRFSQYETHGMSSLTGFAITISGDSALHPAFHISNLR